MTKHQAILDLMSAALTNLARHSKDGEEDWRPEIRAIAEQLMELTDTGKAMWNVLTERQPIEADGETEVVRNRMFVCATYYEECQRVIALYRSVSWRAPYTYSILPHKRIEHLTADWSRDKDEQKA